MLVKNGTAFIGGHFTRADVRVENGKIAQIGLWISTSTPTRARTACAGKTTCAA